MRKEHRRVKYCVFRFYEWIIIGLGGTLMGFFIVLPIIMLGAALSKWKVIERSVKMKGRLVDSNESLD